MAKSAITGAQLRAARALLDWSVRDLSIRCGVSQSAISRAEKRDDSLAMQERNYSVIQQTFEQHGIEFLGTNGLRIYGDKDSSKF